MCSILGYYKLDKKQVPNKDFVRLGFDLMRHRGPDNESFKTYEEVVGLGHQRLSIIDTSESANQPMEFKNSVIVFNGEIYNYLELKKTLLKEETFVTNSDTEVLLRGVKKYGIKFLNQANGMFAFAYFDIKSEELILCRDRFGVKPLYYMVENNILYFSSEIKPLIKIKKDLKKNLEIYKKFIEDTTTDFDEQTFIKEIYQLKKGFYLSCKQGNYEAKQWYWGSDYTFDEAIFNSKDTTIKFTEDLLVDAIKIRLRSDVPLCITLSGGLDSTTIYTLIKEKIGLKITPFTFVNAGSKINEIEKAKKLAASYGEEIIEVVVDSKDGVQEIAKALDYLEFPIWNPSAIAYFNVYKKISEYGFKVILEGHGSDEQLGGYPFMVETAILEFMRGGHFIKAFQALQIYRQMDWTSDNLFSFSLWKSIIIRTILSFFNKEILSKLADNTNYTFNYKILPIVLRTFDRLTMATTLESRSPFMDYRVVEFFKKMPTKYKISGLGSKAILREILKKYHKDFIYKDQKKIGFAYDIIKLFTDKNNKDFFKNYINIFDIKEFVEIKKLAEQKINKENIVWADVESIWKISSLAYINKKYGL